MVRTKGAKGVGELGGNVMDLLVRLFEYYGASIPGQENAPLKAYRRGAEVERVDERTGDVLPEEWAGEGGGEVEIKGKEQ